MPAPYGIIPTGFNPKTRAECLADMEAKQLADIDPNFNLQPTNPIAVENGIMADNLAELWLLGGALYDGMDPDIAADDQLTGDALLTGTQREPPRATVVRGCVVNVDGGFDQAPGTMFAAITGNAAAVFVNTTTVTNPGGSPDDLTADFEAINNGPQQCLAGTLIVISSPLSGWNSITNPTDGVVGADEESDLSLRVRREQELQAAGNSTADAIRSDILKASEEGKFSTPIVNCTVLHNDSDTIDENGIPPHSIEVIAYQPGSDPDDDQTLVDLIATLKAAGIGTWGLEVGTYTDPEGRTELIRFTRPTPIPIYIEIAVTVDDSYPVDGDDEVKEALVSYGDSLGGGAEVFAKHVAAKAFDVAGVEDYTTFKIDTVDPPIASVNIVIGIREVASFDTSQVTVTS